MAWRIDEAVVRGEIDNRIRGRVTGRLWFAGRAVPVELDLAGDCWRDLAGRRLEFSNPSPRPGDLRGLAGVQRGQVGDITASRKVRVPDIPLDQIGEYYAQRKPFPWHWGNALYLEWFGDRNGRVVIETAEFELKMIGEPAWEMAAGEETEQRQANAAAMADFMGRLAAIVPGTREEAEAAADDEDQRPLTEEEAEQIQARCDLLTDRVRARLQREGGTADLAQIVVEEDGRLRRELGEPEATPEERARLAERFDVRDREPEEKGMDTNSLPTEWLTPPLGEEVLAFFDRLVQQCEEQNWKPEGAGEEHPVVDLMSAVRKATVKLAVLLNAQPWPPPLEFCANIIVGLKRARVYLDDALRALESCQEEKLIPPAHLGPLLVEIVDLAHDADELIAELRERLAPGRE